MFLATMSDEGKRLFYSLEMVLAKSDESFDSTEEALIKTHCVEMGIEYKGINDVKVDLRELVDNINSTLSKREKKIIFIELIAVALVDGEYHENEKKVIEEMRKLLNIPAEIAEDAVELVNKLMTVTHSLQNFVEW